MVLTQFALYILFPAEGSTSPAFPTSLHGDRSHMLLLSVVMFLDCPSLFQVVLL